MYFFYILWYITNIKFTIIVLYYLYIKLKFCLFYQRNYLVQITSTTNILPKMKKKKCFFKSQIFEILSRRARSCVVCVCKKQYTSKHLVYGIFRIFPTPIFFFWKICRKSRKSTMPSNYSRYLKLLLNLLRWKFFHLLKVLPGKNVYMYIITIIVKPRVLLHHSESTTLKLIIVKIVFFFFCYLPY